MSGGDGVVLKQSKQLALKGLCQYKQSVLRVPFKIIAIAKNKGVVCLQLCPILGVNKILQNTVTIASVLTVLSLLSQRCSLRLIKITLWHKRSTLDIRRK